jgi:hypothetical protein
MYPEYLPKLKEMMRTWKPDPTATSVVGTR